MLQPRICSHRWQCYIADAHDLHQPCCVADRRDVLFLLPRSRMFDWLVDKINTSIGQDASAKSLIGVLDIYGRRRPEGR